MIKVLFLIPNLGHGGAEKVLINLLKHMNKNVFDISVFCLYDEGIHKNDLPDSISYYSYFKKSFRGSGHLLKLFSPKYLYKHMIKNKYDIVVSYLEGQTARIASGCTDSNTKLISWIHVEQHNKTNAARMFRSVGEMNKCYSKFDYIACVSNFVKKDFLSLLPFIQKEKVGIIYNTVESNIIRRLAEEKIEIKIDQSKINICGIGTLKTSKGFDRLIRIHKKLSDDGYPVHTYLLGEGPEEKKLKQMVLDLDVNDSFTFLGYHTNPYKYLANCDIFVCCSYAEGFSTAATESLIVGTAVCTVDVSGMKEMLGDNNEYGIVTSNDENQLYLGIKKLLSNKELLKEYKAKSLERSKIFDTNSTVSSVEDLFNKLVRRT